MAGVRLIRGSVVVCLLGFGLALGAGAGSADAAVTIGRTEVMVGGPGAAALVTRNPFRLQIRDGAGAVALAEVRNGTPAPSVLSPLADPLAPGVEPARSGQLYAPLAFLVGAQTITQYEGGTWAGNLMSGMRSGVQYAARRVIGVRRHGAGVTLTVATNDPSGRRLLVTVTPQPAGMIRVNVSARPATAVALISDAFGSDTHEAFRGFGGVHEALDQRGRTIASSLSEEDLPGLGNSGPASFLFPNGPTASFHPAAEFLSSRGYGFLLDQPELAWFRLDSDRPDAWSVAARASSLSYVVATGGVRPAMVHMTALTGRQPPPPPWALGPILDRLVKNGTETRADYEAQLQADIANIDRYHLPLTAFRIEGWNMRRDDNDGLVLYSPRLLGFDLQSKLIRELHTRHIHALAYLRPFITPGSYADRAGLTVRTAGGGTFLTKGTLGQNIALLDFSNPAAVRWWTGELAKVFDLGFDGIHADFGEEITDRARFHNGETGAPMHNAYPTLYARATREALTAYERRHPRRQLWFYDRTGYSGTLRARRRTRAATSPATRRPTGATGSACSRSPTTCSTARSAAPTATRPTSAATTTTRRPRPPRSCSSAGRSGRRSARSSASTALAAPARTRRGRSTRRRCRSTTPCRASTSERPR